IVIAIIGLLAAVLIPNLMNARRVAVDRAAEGFAQNVYTAGNAYLATNVAANVAATITANTGADCSDGATFGSYSVAAPSFTVTSCQITESGGDFSIALAYTGGVTGVSPITFPAGSGSGSGSGNGDGEEP